MADRVERSQPLETPLAFDQLREQISKVPGAKLRAELMNQIAAIELDQYRTTLLSARPAVSAASAVISPSVVPAAAVSSTEITATPARTLSTKKKTLEQKSVLKKVLNWKVPPLLTKAIVGGAIAATLPLTFPLVGALAPAAASALASAPAWVPLSLGGAVTGLGIHTYQKLKGKPEQEQEA